MNFDIQTGVSAVTVFFQGVLSFLSPCVLPILPLYLGYLSGSAGPDEKRKGKLVFNTFFFALGISAAFFLLALGFTSFGSSLNRYSNIITKAGGAIIFLLGVYQLGIFGDSSLLSREFRLPLDAGRFTSGPIAALIMGFTFSFGWTPCVGPALTSALLMASSSSSRLQGLALVGVYTLGFTLPFMLAALFAEKLMDVFSRKGNIMKYAQKIGGLLLIIMGVLMFSGYFASPDSPSSLPQQQEQPSADTDVPQNSETEDGSEDDEPIPAPEFTMTDREGNPVSLADFRGKTVFLNFWATWCHPCVSEMPHIQQLYEDYGYNEEDVAVIGVAHPDYYNEMPQEDIEKFLDDNNFTYPVYFDTDADSVGIYGVGSFPTTFMIDAEGNVFGYITGSLSYDIMVSIVEQTISGERVE